MRKLTRLRETQVDERRRDGKREYKLAWDTLNPATGEFWEPSWVRPFFLDDSERPDA